MHKTAMGKQIDMGALIAKNERVRAVGNKKVNARGDTIDSNGKIIIPNTERVNNSYNKTVGNRSAQVKSVPPKQKPKILEELSEVEVELQSALEQEDLEIERLKSKKNGN
jgi:hypothetical protein